MLKLFIWARLCPYLSPTVLSYLNDWLCLNNVRLRRGVVVNLFDTYLKFPIFLKGLPAERHGIQINRH
jgi:hypothetical protein